MKPRSRRPAATLDVKPLYRQVRTVLQERIRDGEWRPGAVLPSEFELARELGVSQGTVRKALDSLARDRLLERHQGRGTFVAEHTPDTVQFRFFQIYDADGRQILPDSRVKSVSSGAATADEASRLGLSRRDDVLRIKRVRLRDGRPFIAETIVLPSALVPGLQDLNPLPNTLYDVLQTTYRVTITGAVEQLTVTAASPSDARSLDVPVGTPLLQIDRIAHDIDDRPIEWRLSSCHLGDAHYVARVGRD